jgi:predicted negative regulator of RcsB-dependent stress response
LPFYRNVQGDRTYDTDQAAFRAARKRLAAPLTTRERQLLLGRNAYEAGVYEQAEGVLRAVLGEAGAPADARAEAAFQLGRVFHAQGRLDEALQAYQYAVLHPVAEPTARWAPWSQFYTGEIFAQRGDTLRAVAAFEAVLAYDATFDYHEALEQQAKAALGRLKEGQ